jgi:uncharacterized protein (UPF0332 family)
MTADQRELLEEARDSISAATLLLNGGYPGYAASRAYYAMFYIAEAFLEGLGMSFSKHSAVIAAFGQHFAQTGKVPAEFHRFLLEAFEIRHKGDYSLRQGVAHNQAQEQIVRRIVETAHPEKIILFGSQAREEARPGSDMDLLVIADSKEPRYRRSAPATPRCPGARRWGCETG